MKVNTIGLILAGTLAGAALAYVAMLPPGLPSTATTSGMPAVGGAFQLTDQTGKRVTEKAFLGRYMLVFFGYTHCPDICPSGLQVMSAALDKLGAAAENVTPVFITVDPERDTPALLADYTKSFHPRLVALTGSREDIAAAAKVYRVYFQKVADANAPESYTYDHSSFFYLMGKDGKFISAIPHTTDIDDFAKKLSEALQ